MKKPRYSRPENYSISNLNENQLKYLNRRSGASNSNRNSQIIPMVSKITNEEKAPICLKDGNFLVKKSF